MIRYTTSNVLMGGLAQRAMDGWADEGWEIIAVLPREGDWREVWLRKSEPDPVAIPPAPSEMPTDEMVVRGARELDNRIGWHAACQLAHNIWRAMRAAAPPSEPPREVVLRKAIEALGTKRLASSGLAEVGSQLLKRHRWGDTSSIPITRMLWTAMCDQLITELEAELAEIGR